MLEWAPDGENEPRLRWTHFLTRPQRSLSVKNDTLQSELNEGHDFLLNVGVQCFSEIATSVPIICKCSDCGEELDRLLPCIFRFGGELGVHWLFFM